MTDGDRRSECVLVLAPNGRDTEIATAILREGGFERLPILLL